MRARRAVAALSIIPAMAAALPLLLLLSAALLRAFAGAQDFDLADALDDPKKPAPTPRKPPGGGGDLDLSDALGGLDPPPPPPPRPRDPQKPDARPAGGDFSDTDLQDGTPGRGRGDGPRGGGGGDEEPQPEGSPQGLVPGLVAAAVAALAGAVSSFVAYQKKKFCFREAGPAPV